MYLAAIKDVLRMLLPSTEVVGSDQEAKLKYVERMNINSNTLKHPLVHESRQKSSNSWITTSCFT